MNADVRVRRLHTVVTWGALLMFASLTLRHVGEAPFLEDQVDQLQNFESLLRLQPEGLWGAIMSGTVPPARALGPIGAIVFGVPMSLGLGVDAIHVTTSLLIAAATAVCFVALSRIDVALAWLWLMVFAATGVVWWNAALLWSNTLLLPAGLTFAALTASCLHRPDRATLGWLIVVLLSALELHLVAVVALPIVVIIAVVTWRDARPSSRRSAWAIVTATVLAVGPYLLGETVTGFANTRAIVGYLGASGVAGRDAGSATTSLAIALDPTTLVNTLGMAAGTVMIVGAALLIAALLTARAGPLFWLSVCTAAGIAGQALFFQWMSRPFAGYHHVTMLAPFYAVAPAVLLRRGVFSATVSPRAACAIGGVVLILLVWAGPLLADRFADRGGWSFTRIRDSLDTLCGGTAVNTDEGQAFAAQLNPQYDSVLRYMMKRGMVNCRYQPSSDVVIAAALNGQYPAAKTIGQSTFYRELVVAPGIARYRKSP